MKKNLITAVCLLISVTMFSQSRDQIVSDIVDLIKSNDRLSEVYYSEPGRELNINGNQIPIANIRYRYKDSNGAMLEFECVSISKRNCIYKPIADKYFEKFVFPMRDKESVYKAIHLLDQLWYSY